MFRTVALFSALLLAPVSLLSAAEEANYERSVARGIEFLRGSQTDDGSWSAQAGPGVTALVTTSLLRHGRTPEDPVVAKALNYLEGFVQPSGGIHPADSKYANYETSLALLCFAEANKGGKYDAIIKKADGYLKGIQWDEAEGADASDPAYGGGGYGSHARPDLSNTTFLIDALKAAGNGADSEAMQRALVFVSRSQNLESEHNTTPFAAKVNDGGFYFSPAAGVSIQAGPTENGGLRSYGSMTYAGLKSMIFAGVDKDDPRVKAAVGWLKKNYDLEQNPGMGDTGLYYYYHTFAKSLDAFGEAKFVDAEGNAHDWRAELVAELASRQQENGSWVNETATRWLEGDANIVTGYSLLALSYCRE